VKRKAVSIRVLVTLLLGLAAGLTVLAAAPPFPINWQGVKAPIPQGGHWFAEASVDGKIYLFGGLASSESESSITLNNTQIYDPATDTWTAGAAMPTGRYLATAAAVGGKIYVMGGRTITSAGAGGPVNANEAYDPATNTWAVMASMPSAVRGHAATVYDNKIYVFGGNTGTYQKTVRIYDPSTNGWSTAANMPQVRAYGAAVYVPSKGRIYYIGGDNGGSTATKYYGTAITFDPSANTWDSGTIDMSDKVSSFGCAFDPSAGDIYVFSGTMWDQANNRDQASSYKVQVLDTATNTFSDSENLPPSPQNRSDCSADCVDGVVYLMGGTVSDKLVDALDVATGDWFGNIAPSPVSADNPNAFNVGGKLYLLNGVSSSLNTAVFSYDPNTGAWTQSGAFNSAPRYAAVADVSDGKIVIADGPVEREHAKPGFTFAIHDQRKRISLGIT
jgi:N-acetylneuraminic acid mutarotase